MEEFILPPFDSPFQIHSKDKPPGARKLAKIAHLLTYGAFASAEILFSEENRGILRERRLLMRSVPHAWDRGKATGARAGFQVILQHTKAVSFDEEFITGGTVSVFFISNLARKISGVEVPKIIREHARNDTLTRLGGKLRRNGLSEAEIEDALQATNRARCRPPLSEDEVSTIAHSVGKYKPGCAQTIEEMLVQAGCGN
jgi:hypothetical protein